MKNNQVTKGEAFAIMVFAMLFLAMIVGLVALDYIAYKQRFPNVDWWTYLFQ